MKSKYTNKDLSLIIPTKDRPEKIKDLLNSIAMQNVQCRRIIIVDGGKSIEQIANSYTDLPIEYYACDPPGQIRQRNLAINKLTPEDELVAFLDDDLVFENRAIEEMINLWNRVEDYTAGISFNIINNPPYTHTWYKALIGMSSKRMGAILKSGYNIPISPVKGDIRSQWLCGGATVWRKTILEKYKNIEIQSRWAICEDITFSYPIGIKYPMYVCADAKVRHEHVYDHNAKIDHAYYGRTATLWRLYFVESNESLSRYYFFYMILAQIFIRIMRGIVFFEKDELFYAWGQFLGMKIGIKNILNKKNIKFALEEDTASKHT